MKLASENEVLALIGRTERVNTTDTIGAALELATAQLESVLGPLDRTDRIDFFGGMRATQVVGCVSSYVLNLTAGWVISGSLSVYYDTDGAPILEIEDDNAELQTSANYSADLQRGRVTLIEDIPVYPYRSVAVAYTSGFEADENGYAQNVPKQLAQAVAAVAARNMRAFPATISNKMPFKEIQGEARAMASAAFRQFIRPRGVGAFPQEARIVVDA